MSKHLITLLCLIISLYTFCQKEVAITIDDVPNTRKFQKDNFNAKLLNKLDSLNIPVAIFINEGLIYKTEYPSKNLKLLEEWINKDFVTLGNHSFNHSRYSSVSLDSFANDILKGESITRELSILYNKPLKHFRFPYNDLGKDSTEYSKVEVLLKAQNYTITPFTIESSDWMFNFVYEYYQNQNNIQEANKIAQQYIEKTLEYFNYFDSISFEVYGRSIKQIYLCHDNSINADYLDVLLNELKENGYSFITLDEAISDNIYSQSIQRYTKWGISWFYRWINDESKIKNLMNNEPDIINIYKEYQKLNSN